MKVGEVMVNTRRDTFYVGDQVKNGNNETPVILTTERIRVFDAFHGLDDAARPDSGLVLSFAKSFASLLLCEEPFPRPSIYIWGVSCYYIH